MTAAALVEVLRDYLDTYEALLDLARRKQDILLSGRATDLEAVVRAEETLLGRLPWVDRRLGEVTRSLTGDDQVEPPLILAILEQLPEPERSRVEVLGSRLKTVVGELRRVGAENEVLLRRALQLVQFTLRLLERSTCEATYSAAGVVAAGGRGPVMDRRA